MDMRPADGLFTWSIDNLFASIPIGRPPVALAAAKIDRWILYGSARVGLDPQNRKSQECDEQASAVDAAPVDADITWSCMQMTSEGKRAQSNTDRGD